MSIRLFEKTSPIIDQSCFVDENSLVLGDVEIGEHSSIWPMTVVRADVNAIRIGHHTNVQDLSVIHVNHPGPIDPSGSQTHIGNYVTIGHRVTLHGCTINDNCLIGMNACVMDHVVIESDVILGAGSLVPTGKTLTGGYLWMGSPARKIRVLTDQEKQNIRYSAEHYVKLKERHLARD